MSNEQYITKDKKRHTKTYEIGEVTAFMNDLATNLILINSTVSHYMTLCQELKKYKKTRKLKTILCNPNIKTSAITGTGYSLIYCSLS